MSWEPLLITTTTPEAVNLTHEEKKFVSEKGRVFKKLASKLKLKDRIGAPNTPFSNNSP